MRGVFGGEKGGWLKTEKNIRFRGKKKKTEHFSRHFSRKKKSVALYFETEREERTEARASEGRWLVFIKGRKKGKG